MHIPSDTELPGGWKQGGDTASRVNWHLLALPVGDQRGQQGGNIIAYEYQKYLQTLWLAQDSLAWLT